MLMRWLVLITLPVLASGCLFPSGELACDPGRSVACVCAGGAMGAQLCKQDGSGYEACVCDTCQDGDISACECPDGSMSTRTCSQSRFGACSCSSEPVVMDMGGEDQDEDMPSTPEDMGTSAEEDMGTEDMAPDMSGPCEPDVDSICDIQTNALRWVDSCGVANDLIRYCGGICGAQDACQSMAMECVTSDCDSICGLFEGSLAAVEVRPAVRVNAPHIPNFDLPEHYPIDVYLRDEGNGMFGGTLEVETDRLAATRDVPVRFVSQGAEVLAQTFAQACSSVHNVERGRYLIEIGPTEREVIRVVISPPIN